MSFNRNLICTEIAPYPHNVIIVTICIHIIPVVESRVYEREGAREGQQNITMPDQDSMDTNKINDVLIIVVAKLSPTLRKSVMCMFTTSHFESLRDR